MKKWTKRIAITLGALIVLLVAAVILIPILFKDKIEAAVKETVNENINATVDWGDWDITLLRNFPNLTVDIAEVKVANRAPFEGTELANIGSLTATIDIMSLFGDKIGIKRLGLVKPRIHVKVLKDGRANWDIALADTTATEEAPADTAASKFNVQLSEYWIEDGRLIYDDASLAFVMELNGLDHKGSGDFTQDLFVLSTSTHADTVNVVFDGVKYLRNAKADITADLDMDMPNMKFTFKPSEATINQLVLGVEGWLAMPTDDIDMDISWNAKKSDLGTLLSLVPAEFATDLTGVKMSGKAGFSGTVKGTYNETTMPGFSLVVDVDNGRFQYPDLPAAVEDIFVDLKINSPGGEVAGCFEAVRVMREAAARAGKPLVAYADEMALSGGYALACAASTILLPPLGQLGSVGAMSVLRDRTKMNEEIGLKVVVVRSGTRKAEGHPDIAITQEMIDREQVVIDRMGRTFADVVSAARGVSTEKVLAHEADVLWGPDAVAARLADDVCTFTECLARAAALGMKTTAARAAAATRKTMDDFAKRALGLLNTDNPDEALGRLSAWKDSHERLPAVSAELATLRTAAAATTEAQREAKAKADRKRAVSTNSSSTNSCG